MDGGINKIAYNYDHSNVKYVNWRTKYVNPDEPRLDEVRLG
jgi:hypothetical protein